jgi:hypothetical protein
MTRVCALLGTLVLVCSTAAPAQAIPISEQTLMATGGDVVVTFVSNGAGYTSELFLDGAFGDDLGAIFNNATTSVGATMNLGPFAAGTELVFRLLVQQTGHLFYTGPGSRNVDGIVHAMIQDAAGRVIVGFEDLFGGGDFDYDDLVFAFTNVSPADAPGTGVTTGAAVDEPSSLLMFGFGLAALVFVMKRAKA